MLPFPCLDRNAAAARQCRKKNQKSRKETHFSRRPFPSPSPPTQMAFFRPSHTLFPLDDLLLFIVRRAEGEKRKGRPTHLSMGGMGFESEKRGGKGKRLQTQSGEGFTPCQHCKKRNDGFSISRNKRESDEGIYFTCHTQIEAG